MKILKFNSFLESLQDDFESEISNKEGKYNLKFQAKLFRDNLPTNQLKDEFMYRVSDGEDIIDLIEEFVDKCDIPADLEFSFRALVLDKRVNQLKLRQEQKPFETFIKIITEGLKIGIDRTIKQIEKSLGKGNDPELLIVMLEDGINYLIEEQSLIRWAYQKQEWNPNEKSIELANELLDYLKSYN